MLREVAKRRFSNKTAAFAKIPDLVIIDGGKGQLSSVLEMVRPLGLSTKFVGLAKRYDEIVTMDGDGNFGVAEIEPNSEEFFLVQRIRDEAHRFAITYHRNLRSKELTASTLDNVPGVGPKTKKKLITHFGSLDKIRAASIDELELIIGKNMAKTIKSLL